MIRKIINNSPYFIKKPIKSISSYIPDHVRYGQEYRSFYEFLKDTSTWSKKQLLEYQLMELQKLLLHAYTNVPYYRRIFDERRLKPEDITKLSDLDKLPYLTKELVRENMNELVAVNVDRRKLIKASTGGSTGLPMHFFLDERSIKRDRAFVARAWETIGYKSDGVNRMVILRNLIPKKGISEGIGKDLILSSFLLDRLNFHQYVEKIKTFEPDFLYAFPSSAAILSRYILENKVALDLKKLKGVLCVSENLSEEQREIIQRAFKVKAYSIYGHSERSVFAAECKKSNSYHISSEYGYTELINTSGNQATQENELCEIVATGFNNYAMPFIRYRTGDLAINSCKSCECGSAHKIINGINGREREYFVDKTNSIALLMRHNDGIWGLKHKIVACQYIQNEPGNVILRLQVCEKLTEYDKRDITSNFLQRHPKIEIKIEETSYIPRNDNGKFVYLVQNVKTDFNFIEG